MEDKKAKLLRPILETLLGAFVLFVGAVLAAAILVTDYVRYAPIEIVMITLGLLAAGIFMLVDGGLRTKNR